MNPYVNEAIAELLAHRRDCARLLEEARRKGSDPKLIEEARTKREKVFEQVVLDAADAAANKTKNYALTFRVCFSSVDSKLRRGISVRFHELKAVQ